MAGIFLLDDVRDSVPSARKTLGARGRVTRDEDEKAKSEERGAGGLSSPPPGGRVCRPQRVRPDADVRVRPDADVRVRPDVWPILCENVSEQLVLHDTDPV